MVTRRWGGREERGILASWLPSSLGDGGNVLEMVGGDGCAKL